MQSVKYTCVFVCVCVLPSIKNKPFWIVHTILIGTQFFILFLSNLGCRWKMQIVGYHRIAHQAPCHWWQQDKDSWSRSPIGFARFGSFFNENWPHWRCNTNSIWFDPPEGRSSRSPSLSLHTKRQHLQQTIFGILRLYFFLSWVLFGSPRNKTQIFVKRKQWIKCGMDKQK